MTPAALLDVDGTLVDSNYHHIGAWNTAFRDNGVVLPLWRLHRAVGMGGERLVPQVAGRELDEALGDAVRERHDEVFAAELGRIAPLPGAQDLLEALLLAGAPVVLCSSAPADELEVYLDLLGVQGRVAVTTADDVEATKPEPDLVAIARERAGGGPAVMVGDTVWDVAAATRAGIPTIALLSGGISAAELSGAGAALIYSGADDLCARLGETPLSGVPASPSSAIADDSAAFSDRA